MSFIEGFAKGFVPIVQAWTAEELRTSAQKEIDYFNNFQKTQEEYRKSLKNSTDRKNVAKALVEGVPGVPPSAWTAVYEQLSMGRNIEKIREDLMNSDFVPRSRPQSAVPETPNLTGRVDDQMDQSGLSQTEDEAPVRRFSFRPDPAQTTDRLNRGLQKRTGMSQEEIDRVRDGFVSDVPAPDLSIVPRGRENQKLTQADVAGAYFRASQQGPEALAEFRATQLPKMLESLDAAGTGARETTDLSRALGELQAAQESGDQTRIERANNNIERILRAENMKNTVRTDGAPRQFMYMGDEGVPVFVQGFARTTAQGRQLEDFQGRPIPEGAREITEAEKKDGDEAIKVNQAAINKYAEDLSSASSVVRLGSEMIDLARTDPRILTAVAGGVRNVQGFAREANSLFSILNDVLKDRGEGSITLREFEREAQRRGALPRGQTFEQVSSGLTLGPTAENIANSRALFESKLILMAFRAGGLEGQSGNAMSNKDFDRLMQSMQASTNPETFERNITGYIQDRIQTLDDRAVQLNSHPMVRRFEQQYGYSPVADLVMPPERFMARDPKTEAAWNTITGRSQTQQAPTQPAVPAQPPAERQAPPEFPGYTFRGYSEEGRPVYQKDGTDELFEME